MKFILLLAVLYLVRAEESENSKQKSQSFQIVLVDNKASDSSESKSPNDQKQSKRSLEHGGWTPSLGVAGVAVAEAGIAAGPALGLAEPIAAAGAPLAVAEGPIGVGVGVGAGVLASGPGFLASGPGIFADSAPVAVSGPAAVAPAGLYTEANLVDPSAYGSGYAPSYARRCCGIPVTPAIQCPPQDACGQLVSQRIEITKPVPYPVYKTVAVAVPHPVPYAVPQPVAVKVPHPVRVEVPVAYPVVKHVPYPVEKPVPFPVDRPFPVKVIKKVPIHIPKPYPVEVPILIKKHIHHYETKHSKWGWD